MIIQIFVTARTFIRIKCETIVSFASSADSPHGFYRLKPELSAGLPKTPSWDVVDELHAKKHKSDIFGTMDTQEQSVFSKEPLPQVLLDHDNASDLPLLSTLFDHDDDEDFSSLDFVLPSHDGADNLFGVDGDGADPMRKMPPVSLGVKGH